MKENLSEAMTIRVEAPEQQTLILLVEHELVIGRESEGLRIADPQVSRRHLRIRRMGTSVEVADLGSTNGSFLDGVPLKGPQVITGNCRVLIGDTTMPRADELPETLGQLTRRNAMTLTDERWDFDVTRLAKVLAIDVPG